MADKEEKKGQPLTTDQTKKQVIDFLEAISLEETESILLEEYLEHNKLQDNKQTFDTLLFFLSLFNVIKIQYEEDKTVLIPNSLNAKYFIKSLSIYLKNNFSLISTWDGLGPDVEQSKENLLTWGVQFANLVDYKRVYKLGEKTPIREIKIILLIIKANVENTNEPQYLFQYNFKTAQYQLVGGYKEKTETDQEAVQRLLNKELFLNTFDNTQSLKISKAYEDIVSDGMSVKDGVFTRYNISLYHLESDQERIKLSNKDRWISLEEMKKGITNDGIVAKSPFADVEDINSLQDSLDKANLSFKSAQRATKNTISKRQAISQNKMSKIEELLKHEESERLEFKSSARWDYALGQINKAIEKAIVKTIAGFLNNGDGTLLLGVDDNKEILGLEKDISTLKKQNEDGYQQYLINIISSYIGVEYCSFVNIEFEQYQEKDICIIEIKKSPQPVFVKENGESHFYVRFSNTTRQLNSEETYKYIQISW